MRTLYIAISLTHVKTEEDRDEIRALLKWLEQRFEVRILKWAFNVDTWTPMPVPNVYEFDTELVLRADLALFFYLTNEGSDGRGGELVTRTKAGKPLLAFIKEGVKENRYVTGCLEKAGTQPIRFRTIDDLERPIALALSKVISDSLVAQFSSTR
jgi:hypothetical protein